MWEIQWFSFCITIKSHSYTLGCEYRAMRSRYSRLLFTSEDRLCAIWRLQKQSMNMTSNASVSRLRDVTDQLWWRHNAKSKNTVLDDNCIMSDWWLLLEKVCVKDIKLPVRNKIILSLPRIMIFGSRVRRFANDFHYFVTRENHWQIASLVTQKPLFTVTHSLFFIS